MPDPYVPSEFGGKVQENRVHPATAPLGAKGHEPTTHEQRMLMVTTGFVTSDHDPDNGEAWEGVEVEVIPAKINRFPGA